MLHEWCYDTPCTLQHGVPSTRSCSHFSHYASPSVILPPPDPCSLPSEVDEDAAASIQAALALALERAITSATLLLREALVGRVRACEAEKQARTHNNKGGSSVR